MGRRLNGQMAIVIGGCMAKVTHLTVGLTNSIVRQNNAHCCYSSGVHMFDYIIANNNNNNKVEWPIDGIRMHNGRTVDSEGNVRWYAVGQLHRTDGPAIEYANGDCFWFVNDLLHRTDGPSVEYASGTCKWYLHGQLHRTDGPAVEWVDGYRAWYLHDKLHNETGPAIIWAHGKREWFLNDEHYTFAEWLEQLDCTPEQRTLLLLKWS